MVDGRPAGLPSLSWAGAVCQSYKFLVLQENPKSVLRVAYDNMADYWRKRRLDAAFDRRNSMVKRPRNGQYGNRALGQFRGRRVFRYGSGRGPYRTGGFNTIRSGRSMLNSPAGKPEKKFLDVTVADATSFDNGGTFILLNGMAQGASQSTRVGNKITMTSIQCRFNIFNGTTQTNTQVVRVIVLYDTQTNALVPAVNDVLADTTADHRVNSPMNLGNRDRFKVIYEHTWVPGHVVDPVDSIGFVDFQKFYKKLRLDTIYNNTSGGTVADIQTGSLYCLVLADVAAGTASPRWQANFRMRYVDY